MRDDPESSGASGEWLSAAALTCAIRINHQAPPPNRKVAVHVGPGAILIGVLSKLPDDFSSDRLAGFGLVSLHGAAGCRLPAPWHCVSRGPRPRSGPDRRGVTQDTGHRVHVSIRTELPETGA